MKNASANMAKSIWRALNQSGMIELETVGGRNLSAENNNRMVIRLRSNWDSFSRFSEGVSGGVIEVSYFGQVIKIFHHEIGIQAFSVEFERLLIVVLGFEAGVTFKDGDIETDYFHSEYEDEENCFRTFQDVKFYVNGVLSYDVTLMTWAYGRAANFQKVHSKVYVCDEDWQGSVLSNSVLISTCRDGNRRDMKNMVEIA